MKNRKKESTNQHVRGADEGVKGFKGVNWLQNVFNPYAKNMQNSQLNESILSYKNWLPPLNGSAASRIDQENHEDSHKNASMSYQGYTIPENQYFEANQLENSTPQKKIPVMIQAKEEVKSTGNSNSLLSNVSLMKTP